VTRVLVLSGSGRYSDPWHPLAQTSARLADILRERGHDVEVSSDIDDRLTDLSEVDVLVVNASDSARHDADADVPTIAEARSGLLAFHARGGGIVAVHSASLTLRGIPEWPDLIGGRWVIGTSMHPDIGEADIHVLPHAVTTGVADFRTFDERYSSLEVHPRATPLGWHAHDGAAHPLMWALQSDAGRAVYLGLGHDDRAYEAPETRLLVGQAVQWAAPTTNGAR
jgi:type 1 glutamine amidotransferase